MERLVVFYFVVLLALALCMDMVKAYSAEITEAKKKDESPLWFGPRIGRKKRNPAISYPSGEDDQKLRDIINSLDEYPWARLSVNGGDSKRTLSFTPRLGRTLEDSFIPRLGRTLEDIRLGRNSEDDMFDERSVGRHSFSPRLGRMVF